MADSRRVGACGVRTWPRKSKTSMPTIAATVTAHTQKGTSMQETSGYCWSSVPEVSPAAGRTDNRQARRARTCWSGPRDDDPAAGGYSPPLPNRNVCARRRTHRFTRLASQGYPTTSVVLAIVRRFSPSGAPAPPHHVEYPRSATPDTRRPAPPSMTAQDGSGGSVPGTDGRPATLRQSGDHRVVGGVEQLTDLVVGDRAGPVDGVPAVPADVVARRDGPGVPVAPLGGLSGVPAALHADRAGSDEGEALSAHLGDEFLLAPRIGLLRTRLGEAVGDQLLALHRHLLTTC